MGEKLEKRDDEGLECAEGDKDASLQTSSLAYSNSEGLFIRDIPADISAEALAHALSKFGALRPGSLALKTQKGRDSYAFVDFQSPRAVESCISEGIEIEGHRLCVELKLPHVFKLSTRPPQSNNQSERFHEHPASSKIEQVQRTTRALNEVGGSRSKSIDLSINDIAEFHRDGQARTAKIYNSYDPRNSTGRDSRGNPSNPHFHTSGYQHRQYQPKRVVDTSRNRSSLMHQQMQSMNVQNHPPVQYLTQQHFIGMYPQGHMPTPGQPQTVMFVPQGMALSFGNGMVGSGGISQHYQSTMDPQMMNSMGLRFQQAPGMNFRGNGPNRYNGKPMPLPNQNRERSSFQN